jgi:hypothetical protein
MRARQRTATSVATIVQAVRSCYTGQVSWLGDGNEGLHAGCEGAGKEEGGGRDRSRLMKKYTETGVDDGCESSNVQVVARNGKGALPRT